MAGKISINPDAIKRNLDLIIVTVATLALLGYGWSERGATETVRTNSAETLKNDTERYNRSKNFPLPESLGLTNEVGRIEVRQDENGKWSGELLVDGQIKEKAFDEESEQLVRDSL